MQFFNRNAGNKPSLSHMLRAGMEGDPGWKVRLFIKWIKEFGGSFEPFVPGGAKPKHHSTPDAIVLHSLREDRHYTDSFGQRITRRATHAPMISRIYGTEIGDRRVEVKRDKSISARQWKKQVKAARRQKEEAA